MSRLLVVCLLFGLAGCGTERAFEQNPAHVASQAAIIGVALDGFSLINTGKTIDDHVISLVTGKDCSIVRASQGGPYCVDIPPPVPQVAVTSYCYKSLASVSCFAAPLATDEARFDGSRTDMVPITQ